MRRGLGFVSAALVVMGLELSTGAVTVVARRLGLGVAALLGGNEFHVAGFRFVAGVVALLLGLALWLLLAWSARKRAVVGAVGDGCPNCGNVTRRVKRREWQRLLSALLGERLMRRRCETCGWVGLSREL